jgi:predicted alpha/beta-hydrolase family hydrolase
MRAWAERLCRLGSVTRFDYPYMLAGKRRPSPHAELVEAHRRALESVREHEAGPVVLIGKSMGSRIGCHVATTERVTALVCFGFPLRAQGSGKMRDEVLLALRTPVLFVQGTRDPLCPLELLAEVRARMTAENALHVVEGGDHSLEVRKRELALHGSSQARVDDEILTRIEQFLAPRGNGRSVQNSGPS